MKPPPVPPAANPADFGKPGISRVLRGRTPAPSLLRRAAGVEDAVAALAAVLLPDGMKSRVVKTPDGDKAVIHRSWFKHIVDRRDIAGNRDPRERFAEWIIPTLRSPDEIWLVGDRKRFIKVFLNQEKVDCLSSRAEKNQQPEVRHASLQQRVGGGERGWMREA